MNKIKFILTALTLVALMFIGCEKNEQILSSAEQADDSLTKSNAGSSASVDRLVALTATNRLLQFSSKYPQDIHARIRVTGLQEGEKLLGIDFRPFNGQLYGLGSSSRLYIIDPSTGSATAVGAAPFSPGLDGEIFGFDFNPTVDRIRVVGNTGLNLRLHPDLGTVVDFDPNTAGTQPDLRLAYATTDANANQTPSVVGAAYTNPDNDPATGTTLYDIDVALDVLVIQNLPNNGTLNTVGSLAFNLRGNLVGFDIAASGTAYMSHWNASEGQNRLVTVNLTTGALTRAGLINTEKAIVGLAVMP